jgi:NSS family neurotransmitter:Na+ symporter
MIVTFAGWVLKTAHAREELACSQRFFRIWHFTIRYLSPVVILLIFLSLTGLIAL